MTGFNDNCSLFAVPPVADLSDLQLAVMRALWDAGEASAAEVRRALSRSRPLAITTVATLLARLEKRGVVAHRALGRGFVYRATVPEREVRRSMLAGLVRNLFRSDAGAVVTQLLSARDVSPGDLAKIRELLAEAAPAKPRRRRGAGGRRR